MGGGEKEGERHYIPKVKPETSSSDPESRPIAHSLKERDKTGEEGRKEEGKIKRERGGWGGAMAPTGILNHSRPRHSLHQGIRSRFSLCANDQWRSDDNERVSQSEKKFGRPFTSFAASAFFFFFRLMLESSSKNPQWAWGPL